MRILLANAAQGWGGGEHWHLLTARELLRQGHDVLLLAHPRGPLAARAAESGAPLALVPIDRWSILRPMTLCAVYRSLRAFAPDAVIVNSPIELKVVAPIARRITEGVVVYRRGSAGAIRATQWNRWLLRHCVHLLIANSEATRRAIFAHDPHIVPSERVVILPNGVPGVAAAAQQAESPGIRLATAGRLVPLKGQEVLLEITQSLLALGLPVSLQIAGEGPMRAALEARAERLGIAAHVRLLGQVRDIPAFLASQDIFVFASRSEGFGFAVAEAQAAGLPVVAFETGSLAEVTRPGQSALLVPDGDRQAFIDAIVHLAADSELRRRMGAFGRAFVESEFGLERRTRELVELLQRARPLLASRPAFEDRAS